MNFRTEARRRLIPHAVAIFLIWPAVSVISAAYLLFEHPFTLGVPFRKLLLGSLVGAVRLAPEWFVVGLAVFVLSVLLFAAISTLTGESGAHRRRHFAEPIVLALAGMAGVALEYPAVLRHVVLIPVRTLAVSLATGLVAAAAVLFGAVVGWEQGRVRGAMLTAAVAAIFVPATWAASRPSAIPGPAVAGSRQTVLFGIDSVAQTDDVGLLRQSVRRLGGTWYEKPVPPGLLTNSVWPAIVLDRPVSQTAVFLIHQTPDWDGSPFNMVRGARARGCRTYALFPSRITFYLGRDAGFEVDRGGPRGWLHYATAFVKDASVFLPVALPRLREIPGSIAPVNQSGTFSYSLRRDVRAAFTAGARDRCAFVATHLDYLHQGAYPGYSELNAAERRRVRGARAESIRDVSLHWQPPEITGEPLDIEAWKLRHLQRTVGEEIGRTRFVEKSKANRLVLFSDHGNRRLITETNFGDPRYHRVLFATFGIPPRDPKTPISLLDIAEMLGFADERLVGRADPLVEYVNATGEEWKRLQSSARLKADGHVWLDPMIVRAIGQRLQGYRPYASGGYFPAPLRRSPPE